MPNTALSLRGIGLGVSMKTKGSALCILAPACAVLIGAATPTAGTDAAAPSLKVVLRPETDAAGKVVGLTVEQRIVPGGTLCALSLNAPLRFAGFVPVALVVANLEVADANGSIGMSATDLMTPDHGPIRRWTSSPGTVTVRYRLPLTPFAQGGRRSESRRPASAPAATAAAC